MSSALPLELFGSDSVTVTESNLRNSSVSSIGWFTVSFPSRQHAIRAGDIVVGVGGYILVDVGLGKCVQAGGCGHVEEKSAPSAFARLSIRFGSGANAAEAAQGIVRGGTDAT